MSREFLLQSNTHDPCPTEGHGEKILVVEDNAAMRRVVVEQLAGAGYKIFEAANELAALAILRECTTMDLLFTDIVMVGRVGGRDLARTAVTLQPQLKVLLTSGFSESRLDEDDAVASNFRLFSKPYSKKALLRAVREVIDD